MSENKSAPVAQASEFEAWYDTVVKYVEPSDIAAWMHDAWDAGRASAPAPVAQPLTDEQIRDLDTTEPLDDWPDMIAFARAVERAHGITGEATGQEVQPAAGRPPAPT